MKTENEIIAEFMGFISHQSETYGIILQHPDLMGTYQDHTRQNQHGKAMELKYHSSWAWLMPVVEKIENIEGLRFIIEGNRVMISSGEYFWNSGSTQETKLTMTYWAVIEFIKWYNKNKKV